jgi:hypothetical protein
MTSKTTPRTSLFFRISLASLNIQRNMNSEQAPTYSGITKSGDHNAMSSEFSNDEDYTMKHVSESSRKLHEGEEDEDDNLDSDDDLSDSIHVTKRRFNAEHVRWEETQKGAEALDEEDSLHSADEDDLSDSIHVTKRRLNAERVSWEKTRKGLEHMVGWLDSDEDDGHLRDSNHITKRRFNAETVRIEETRKRLEQMAGYLDSASAPMVQEQTTRAKAA